MFVKDRIEIYKDFDKSYCVWLEFCCKMKKKKFILEIMD